MTMQKVVQDSSGIVGLFNVEQAAQNIYLAMHAIQHRGQDGVGVAVSDRENVVCKKPPQDQKRVYSADRRP